MSKIMSWSRNEVQMLIDLYQKHSCLYAVKSASYKNKHARLKALTEIETELKKIKPEVTVAEIKCKFNNLRTNFLSEYRKFKASNKSGIGADEIYRPTLWYFDMMMFIVEHTIPRSSKDSISENLNLESGGEFGEEMEQYEEYLAENHNGEENIIIDIIEHPPETDSNSDVTKTPNRNEIVNKENVPRKQRKRKRIDEDDVLATTSETMQHLAEALSSNKKLNSNGLQGFAEFITSKLEVMVDDPDILEETEEDIANLIFTNLKRYRDNKRNHNY